MTVCKNTTHTDAFLKEKSDYIRNDVIEVAVRNGAGHIAPSLSCVDILVALYYRCMSYDVKNHSSDNRDRLIFSKAHGCYALYSILADKGILPEKEWRNFYKKESALSGCVEKRTEYGFEASCGSLGHGLPMAAGLAYGAKKQGKGYYVFCVVGDGEMQEGTTWESLQFAVKHELANLVVIVDRNRLQAMDFIVNIMDRKETDIADRLKGFGLSPVGCPGHDVVRLSDCINTVKGSLENRPKVIIAETIKGYGLKCMEDIPRFHFRMPTEEELALGRDHECRK